MIVVIIFIFLLNPIQNVNTFIIIPQIPDITDNNFDILSRLFNLFNALAGRNVYYALLNENKQALSQLINLASKSSWIVNLISNHPILLDELLDSQSLYSPVTRQSLNDELNYFLQQINVDDMDELLNALRQFKNPLRPR